MMPSRPILLWGAALLAGIALAFALFGSEEPPHHPRPAAAAAITPASDAAPVALHLDGARVGTVLAAELDGRRAVVDLLPPRARDTAAWTVVRVFGAKRSQFVLEEPARRMLDRDLLLFLQQDGHPAIGLFRRLHDEMSPDVRAALARPGLFLPRVTDVYVWTIEEPRRETTGPTLILTVQGSTIRKEIAAGAVEALPTVDVDAGRGHDGRRVLDVVGLAVDAARVERVRIVGGGEPLDLTRAQLREPDVAALLRVNKRGLWAFDLSGRLPTGEPQSARRRGVKQLVVALGSAEALPESARTDQRPEKIHRTKQSPEEKARIRTLLDLSREAPDADARAKVRAGLQDPSPHVRLRAVRSLRAWDDALPDLWDHLQGEEDVEIQRACLKTVGDRGDATYIERLRTWAEGRSKRVRKDTGKAMRRIATREGLPEPERLIERRR